MFTFPQKVLFRHCDPAGIMFYPRCFEIMNDAVEAFFDSMGYPFEEMHPAANVPTASINCQFKAPSRHGEQLLIQLRVKRVGSSSLELEHRALCNEQIRFVNQSVLVHTNEAGQAQRWPDTLRDSLDKHARDTQ